jgi:O-antigen ligase
MALCLRQILSAGSRGALLSLAITAVFIVLTGSKRMKASILVGVPILLLAAIPFVPAESLSRLSTLFSSSAAAKNGEAVESSEARMALLQESWKLTLQHPFAGVGPGEFMDYQAKVAGESGERGMWHVTHNSYTQVSSECGIPAFLFYLGAFLLTLSNLRKVIKSKDPELAPVAWTVSVMIVAYGVCIFFLSQAYSVHLLIVSGLAVSMKLSLPKTSLSSNPAQMTSSREAVPV